MLDHFREEVVTRKNKTMENIMMALANISMVVSGLLAMFMLQTVLMLISSQGLGGGMLIYVLLTLLLIAAAVLLFLFRDRIRTEYEYTFTNGTMDFAQVFNNRKRKALGTMNIRNVEACGLVSSGSFHRYLNTPGVVRLNWFLNRDAELFYFYFVKDSKKSLMVIEPSQEMVDLIKKFVGQGKFQTN
ncbi:MAG: hypothetical protein GXY84_09425 [Clostridiales bacterium]|nr:hypothetical protein [Clostridiales bacterium]